VLTGTAGVRTTMSLLAGWIGLSVTAAEVTHTPRGVWAAVILAGVVLMLTRGARLTLTTVAMVGVVATVLMILASLLALADAGPGDLGHADVPLGGGPEALDPTVGAALGVVLMQYIGSVYLLGIHRAAAPRDPGGRTLAAGAFVGTVGVTLIVGLWLIAASAAVPASELQATSGTAMGPLSDEVGPVMAAIGGLASLLLLGMNINRTSVAVHELVLERLPPPREAGAPPGTRSLSRPVRALLALVPVLLVFAVSEITLDLGDASFSSVLTISGVVTNFLVGAAFPVLMVLAARRRGELVPALVWRWIGAPLVAWAIVAGSIVALVAVGLFVWDDWGSRSAALAMAALGALTVSWVIRRRSFRRRCLVELIDDRRAGGARWALVAGGRPLAADVELAYAGGGGDDPVHAPGGPVRRPDALRGLSVHAPDAAGARQLVVWGQRVNADGSPEPIAASAQVGAARVTVAADGEGESPPAPLPPGAWSAEVRLGADAG
jgi:hypothetical protein